MTDTPALQVKELDPDNALATTTVQRLTPVVNERRERMKDEMLGAQPQSSCNGLMYSSTGHGHGC